MRNISLALTFSCLSLLFSSLLAQTSYLATFQSTGGNPGGINTDQDNDDTGWNSILPGNLNANIWSTNQNIPFSFSFFGTPVTQFKVSANGLLTFTTGTALLPGPNGNLPDPGLPDNTIACFWDDFTSAPPTGGNDEVFTRVYGSAGSQQLWIKWFSFEYGNPSGNSFSYFACVLEEGSNHVYLVDMSNSANVPNMSTTVGVQKDATTAVQYGSPNITFGTANSSNPSNNRYYEFEPFTQLSQDLLLLSLDSPGGDGCYTNSTPVSIQVLNIGTSSASGMTATFATDGQTFVSAENLSGTLAPGDTLSYTFSAQADLSTVGNYDMKAVVSLPGDGDMSNDTLSRTINSFSAIVAPFSEDFDGGFPASWINDPMDDGEDWKHSGTNGTANFGPQNIDHTTGSGDYMWVDDGSPHSKNTHLISPCIDLTNISFPSLEFWLWSFNQGPGQDVILHIDIESAGLWTNDFIGPFVGQAATGWNMIQANLSAYAGQVIRIRFRTEENGGGFEHDVAIDDVSITEILSADAQLLSIVKPSGSDCGLTATDTVSIQVRNGGGSAAIGITASFSVDGNTPIPAETIPDTLQPGDTTIFTFTSTADFSALGIHTLEVFVSQTGDGDMSNDTIFTNISNLTGFSAPYSENFDGGFPADWLNDPNDGGEEWINSATQNSTYGPDGVDHTSGTGEYMWVDDGGPNSTATNLISPCIDLTTLIAPELEFWVWSNNEEPSDGDVDLHIDINADGVWVDDVIPAITDMDSMWEQVVIDLAAYSGTIIKVRFRTDEFNTGFRHDVAIDDFSVFEELDDDVSVTQILAPFGAACGFSANEDVTIEIKNLGLNSISGLTGSFQVDGSGFVTTENIPGTLAPGASTTYTFTAKADLSSVGQHSIDVVASGTGDQNPLNDSLVGVQIDNLTATNPPFAEDFESYADGTTSFTNLFNVSTAQVPWQVITGPTPTGNTGPDDDASGGGSYIYLESSGTDDGNQGILCFDCVDLTSFNSPNLIFSYHMYGSAIGSLSIDVSSGGSTTNEVSLTGQQQTSNADAWITDTVDLSAYAGSIIQICFTAEIQADGNGSTFNGDFALDNLQVEQVFGTDVAAIDASTTAEICNFTDAEPIIVDLYNAGTDPVSNIIASYSVNGGSFSAPEIVAGPIAAGDTLSYQFMATADLSAQGIYDIVAAIAVNGDDNPTNDTITASIANDAVNPIAGFTYVEDMKTVTFTNTTTGGGTLTYTWDFGDQVGLSSDVDPVYTYANDGSYAVKLIATNECGISSSTQDVLVGNVGIDDAFAAQIQIFPNPSTGLFEIRFEQAQLHEVNLKVLTLQGKSVYQWSKDLVAGPSFIPVRLSDRLAEGVYLLHLQSREGTTYQRLILHR
ncbi:MAG: CARDB domain-containing protein [Bacteroidota bacterium]